MTPKKAAHDFISSNVWDGEDVTYMKKAAMIHNMSGVDLYELVDELMDYLKEEGYLNG